MSRKKSMVLKKDPRSGVYFIAFDTAHGRRRISTGERSYSGALELCDEAMIEKLKLADKAGVLNANAISLLTTGRRFTCIDVLAAWKEDATANLAPDTLNDYEQTISLFFQFRRIENTPIGMVTRAMVDDFVNEDVKAIGVRRNRLTALRSFFAHACNAGYCVGNLGARVKVRRRQMLFDQKEWNRRPVYPITPDEYERIIASEKVDGFFRWATALAYWLGLRIRDVACLEWASIKADTIIVHTQKTGVRVALPLDNPLIGSGDLRKVIMEMIENTEQHPVYCFPKERALALDITKRAFLSVYYARVLKRCGIKGKCFHGLRHAFACRLEAAGMTIEQIGELIGHENPATTKIYLQKPTEQTSSPQPDVSASVPESHLADVQAV